VERLDDDGAVQTNGWVQAAALVHDSNTNESFLEIGEVRAQRLLIGPEPQGNQPVTAWIDGKLRTTDHLETAAKLRTDTIAPFAGIVRVEGIGLIVDGELRTDTIRARDVNGTTSVSKLAVTDSLTVGGVSFASLQFTAVEPLRKVVNLQTGAVELRVDTDQLNPFWVAGKVDSNGTVLVSKGRVAFTVTQTATGNYRVDFAQAHPNGVHYVVSLASVAANYWIDGSSTTASSFLLATRASNFGAQSSQFHFSVLA
jgi:hypothetical protein